MKKFILLALIVMIGLCSEKAQSESGSGTHREDTTSKRLSDDPVFEPGPVANLIQLKM